MAEQTNIRPALEHLLANRRTPEAHGLYVTLARYAHRRVDAVAGRRYSDILSQIDREEIVGETLLQLMSGALARFRGHSVGELLAFVRTIADRLVGHTARRRIRERDTLSGEVGDEIRSWAYRAPAPDTVVRLVPDCPLTQTDADYLEALFASGSRADFARESGISRAAVTQRLNRIRARIEEMPHRPRSDARVWVEELALRSGQVAD